MVKTIDSGGSKGMPAASSEQLFHLLAEAAELEHNILCSYLYAVFSLKEREDEGVTASELLSIERWRKDLMGLCFEEMVHLAQVCNLLVSLGCRPHVNRPNLPVAPGYHPAGVVIGLTPFSQETLDHFIFLERPGEVRVNDSDTLPKGDDVPRNKPAFVPLMPRAPAYETIGGFYEALRVELERSARDIGDKRLFSGPASVQLTSKELNTPDLVVVRSIADARRAIDFIVEQGEGSGGRRDDSHFGRFESIKDELLKLQAARPDFKPARAAARHPVMHAPVTDDRTWINGMRSAPVIDAANGVYCTMLRCLALIYEIPASDAGHRQAVLGAAMACMKAVAVLGSALTDLPASEDGSTRAGMSFAMLRSVEGLVSERASPLLAERLTEIANRVLGFELNGASQAALLLREAASGLRIGK